MHQTAFSTHCVGETGAKRRALGLISFTPHPGGHSSLHLKPKHRMKTEPKGSVPARNLTHFTLRSVMRRSSQTSTCDPDRGAQDKLNSGPV